ncbi:MAG: thioredoxin family protein [Nitrospirae bacterium]|nr:thioredoxin family protein [Nitrospirota bacterium]
MRTRNIAGAGALLAVCLLLAFSMSPCPAVAAEKPGVVNWTDYAAGMARAKKEGKPVLVDFYTTWCKDCKKMDKTTLADPEVVKLLAGKFVAVRVDGDTQKETASKYGVFAYPTFCMLGPDGGKVYQNVGYLDKSDFMVMLEYASSGAYKTTKFKEYYKSRKK